jgi:ferrochelatase
VSAGAPVGALLVQLGTPASTEVADVRRYLRQFLSDPRVIDIPAVGRWLLVHAVILPFRAPRSAEAYRSIWMPEGSPLLHHTRALAAAVAERLGPGFRVEVGMRYGAPSLPEAVERLRDAGVERVVVLPLFPQYAGSSSGSALEETLRVVGAGWNVPEVRGIGPFFDDPGFVGAVAEAARPVLEATRPDHVLLSYHGLPERQIRRSDPTGRHCLASADCCAAPPERVRGFCYRAQCVATSRAVADALGLAPEAWSTSFQSRLGRTPWIRPYTDEVLPELAGRGVRRLLVLCPSFVADCLETLEEIGIRARAQWAELGGEAFGLAPCVNAAPGFAEAVAGWIRRAGTAAVQDGRQAGASSPRAAAAPEARVSDTPTPAT